ncbi:glycosyltransferase [Cronobacter dublinensis]|uniref:glycosyltransferase n=1 Tax=Cronobacter dublinensis TaxID=413497 RepID=UPI000CFD18DB|nr:glycosyltransferase [Cronobacter dublinensis]MDT3605706.1 glycosyltransferase [Cronobacter dublinensis]
MNILLVGEFSGVHMTLARALKDDGHNVIIVSDGDSYKNFSRDITITAQKRKGKFAALARMFLDVTGTKGLITYFKHRKVIAGLKGYDVVQIINTVPLDCFGSIASYLFVRKLKENNKKLFLCALGDDYRWVKACLLNRFKYSALSNLTIKTLHTYIYSLKYVYGMFFKKLHMYVEKQCDGIIPGLIEYAIAYEGIDKVTPIIPLPLPKKIFDEANSMDANVHTSSSIITIFHGWQVGRELKKGNFILDEAVKRILQSNLAGKIDYQIVKSVPFDEYITRIKSADIFLDQTYSYDRGMNAIFGMAYSSVVFSGFEYEKEQHIGISAEPDVDLIEKELIRLIDDPVLMKTIKNNARDYALKRHNPEKVMRNYLNVWQGYNLDGSQTHSWSLNGNNK